MRVPSEWAILEEQLTDGFEFDEVSVEGVADPDEAVFAQEELFAEDQEGQNEKQTESTLSVC